VPGMSENIRVIGVIGRFLEHARIYHFGAGKADPLDGDWYIGSADWMYRNLNNRVEVLVPVRDPLARKRLNHIRELHDLDHRTAWDLLPTGEYVERMPPPGAPEHSPEAQGVFLTMMNEALAGERP